MIVAVEYYTKDGELIQSFVSGETIIAIKEDLRPGDSVVGLITQIEYEDGFVEYVNLDLLN